MCIYVIVLLLAIENMLLAALAPCTSPSCSISPFAVRQVHQTHVHANMQCPDSGDCLTCTIWTVKAPQSLGHAASMRWPRLVVALQQTSQLLTDGQPLACEFREAISNVYQGDISLQHECQHRCTYKPHLTLHTAQVSSAAAQASKTAII